MGTVGSAIARRAAAMRMEISYTSRSPKPMLPYRFTPNLEVLASECDILIVSCPATEQTRRIVDAAVLKALGPDGWLVNIARGSIVHEAALVAALHAGEIAGAGLDVARGRAASPRSCWRWITHLPHMEAARWSICAAMGRDD